VRKNDCGRRKTTKFPTQTRKLLTYNFLAAEYHRGENGERGLRAATTLSVVRQLRLKLLVVGPNDPEGRKQGEELVDSGRKIPVQRPQKGTYEGGPRFIGEK